MLNLYLSGYFNILLGLTMSTIIKNENGLSALNRNISAFTDLDKFLKNWDKDYQKKISTINIFDNSLTKQWNNEQCQLFVKVLYHIRGHFDSFLWYMGNFAPDYKTKQMILRNVHDEFGMNGLSHEQLYFQFAQSFGVDLTYELLEETSYLSFAREYIKNQLLWLRNHDWDHRLAAFAAIERLDNVDYLNLRHIAESLGATGKALTFFNVHIKADHFECILVASFQELWKEKPLIAHKVFNFISEFQTAMWKNLSDAIFNYNNKETMLSC